MTSDKTTDPEPAKPAEKPAATRLKGRGRQAYRVEELPDELFDLIDRAEYGKSAG